MEKIITFENIRNFAYVNTHLIKGDVRGIIIFFEGLGGQVMFNAVENEIGVKWAEKNVIYVYPYNNPWNWMNKRAIDTTDEIIDALFDYYNLPSDTPIISSGHSMGGQASLVYSRYSHRTPTACVANCPVCDMVYHYTERIDLPRTLYSAFGDEDGTLSEVLARYSPLHLADTMPDIPYYIFHCENDNDVNIDKHTKRFIDALGDRHKVVYNLVPDKPHCELDDAAKAKWDEYCALEIGL